MPIVSSSRRTDETALCDSHSGTRSSGLPRYPVHHRLALAVAVLSTVIATAPTFASEGPIAGGPTGGTDLRNAYLPGKPGFYGGVVALTGFADSLKNGGGGELANAKANITVPAVGLTYVYPFKLAGGTLASGIQGSYQFADVRVATRRNNEKAFGDLYTDLFAWSRHIGPSGTDGIPGRPKLPYGLTVKLGYAMIFPTGHYRSDLVYTAGHNDIYYIPNAAATYLSGPNALGDGVEYSAHAFFDISSRNAATDYKSGTVTDVDFAVTERRGRLQAGLAGFYVGQLNADRKAGVTVAPDGKKLEQLYLGPIVALDIPKLKGTIKFKANIPVVIHNSLNAARYILVYSFRI